MNQQDEFLFFEGSDSVLQTPDPLGDLLKEIAVVWNVPLGVKVTLRLKDPALPELCGKLELTRAPDLPLDPRQRLTLRIQGVEFSNRDIAAWCTV